MLFLIYSTNKPLKKQYRWKQLRIWVINAIKAQLFSKKFIQKVNQMNVNDLMNVFLQREQQNLPEIIREYLIINRNRQYQQIKRQAPNLIGRKYNLLLTIILTLCIVGFNYDQLFVPPQVPTQLIAFQNFEQVEKKVEYVFEQTIMRYTVIYPLKIKECQSYLPYVREGTFCSQKSIEAKVKFIYNIGFRPNFQKLSYDSKNNTIVGEWGQLEILGATDQRVIESQINGFMNSWSALEFEQKYNLIKKAIKPKIEEKINDYIENITSNSQSIQRFEKNIRNSLMKIVGDGKKSRGPLSDRILTEINGAFDKILVFFSLDPLFPVPQPPKRDTFSPQDATQFWKEQVLGNEEVKKIQTQIDRVQIDRIIYGKGKANQQKGSQTKGKKQGRKTKKQEAKNQADPQYNSQQIRAKYNQLLKKVK